MQRLAPQWLGGCKLRDIWFQPTFHKHVGELSSGVHIHADGPWYDDAAFQPWSVPALGFKAIRSLYPDYPIWRGKDFKYEYTDDVPAIDVINDGPPPLECAAEAGAAAADRAYLPRPEVPGAR